MKYILLLTILLSGCSPVQIINPNSSLKPGSGLVLLSAYCEWPLSYISIYKAGTMPSEFKKYSPDQMILCGKGYGIDKQGIKLANLPAGKYFLGTVGAGTSSLHFKGQAYNFLVKPNEITYIGSLHANIVKRDFDINHNTFSNTISIKKGYSVSLVAKDEEHSDKNKILSLYPNLLSQYEYNKKITTKEM